MLFGDLGTSRLYVLGLAFYFTRHASLFHIIFVNILLLLVGSCYLIICRKYPDGGGVYSAVKTDVLLVANSSNMGAHAVTAGLALLRRDLSLCHTAEQELALAHLGVDLGLVDGGNGELRPWCDGIPPAANAAVVEVLRTIVSQSLLPEELRKF
jgi:hypothetical protein